MCRIRRVKLLLLSHEEVALSLLVVNGDALFAADDVLVLTVDHEEILELLLVHVLCGTVFAHKEKSRMRDSLRRRQELALIFDVLTIFAAR